MFRVLKTTLALTILAAAHFGFLWATTLNVEGDGGEASVGNSIFLTALVTFGILHTISPKKLTDNSVTVQGDVVHAVMDSKEPVSAPPPEAAEPAAPEPEASGTSRGVDAPPKMFRL